MARSAEELRLDEPYDHEPGVAVYREFRTGETAARPTDGQPIEAGDPLEALRRGQEIQEFRFNPLREEPSPTVIKAVRRFGVVGLVTCALASGVSRWWHSIRH